MVAVSAVTTAWRGVVNRALLVACALVLTGCAPPPPDEASHHPVLPVNFPTGSTMKRIHDSGRLAVGVGLDQPNLALVNPDTGQPEGFDIEIAKIVAAGLGLRVDQIEFVKTLPGDRGTYLRDGNVDVVINTYSITDARKQIVAFAGPYLQTGQDLLIRRDELDIDGPDDLAGRRVCALTGTTSLGNIQQNYPTIVDVPSPSYSGCVEQLTAGTVDAVTSDGAILLGYAARAPHLLRVVGNPFSVELYGVGLPHHDTQMRLFLDDVLEVAMDDGRWRQAYDATLGRSGNPAPSPPVVFRY